MELDTLLENILCEIAFVCWCECLHLLMLTVSECYLEYFPATTEFISVGHYYSNSMWVTAWSQSLPASGSFPMSQLFSSGGQSIGVSASASVLSTNIQDWFPLGWTGWISLQSKGLSRVFSNPQFKSINSSALSFLHSPTLTSIHDYWKNYSID